MKPPLRQRRRGIRSGVAALEFALVMPLMIACAIGVVDFGYAFNCKLRLSSAVSAAAQYAFLNGQTLASTGVTGFLTNVQSVVTGAVDGLAPTVTVLYNNAATNANFNACYCVTPTTPVTWTAATCGNACTAPAGVSAGKYVTITAHYAFRPFFSGDTYLARQTNLSDTALLRVQ